MGDKTKRIEEMVNDLQKQVDATNSRVKAEEDQKEHVQNQSGRVKGEAEKLRGDIKLLQAKVEGCEDDKVTKDNQIRTLKEELMHQEELITKLHKEKRSMGDGKQKVEEDVQAMEDKCNHLNKVKHKLEQQLDE